MKKEINQVYPADFKVRYVMNEGPDELVTNTVYTVTKVSVYEGFKFYYLKEVAGRFSSLFFNVVNPIKIANGKTSPVIGEKLKDIFVLNCTNGKWELHDTAEVTDILYISVNTICIDTKKGTYVYEKVV